MDEFTPDRAPRRVRPQPGVAWFFIVLLVLLAAVLPQLLPPEAAPGADDGGVVMRAQGKILAAGGDEATGRTRTMYIRQAEAFNTGSVGQRQRAIVLIADIGGADLASVRLAELDELIEELAKPDAENGIELTEEQQRVQEILRTLYGSEPPGQPDADRPRVELLDQADRDLLVAELGWFGELALVPREGPDRRARQRFLSGPLIAATLVSLIFIVVVLLGVAGLVGLIVLLVFAFGGRLGRGLAPGGAHHGLYAETFAIWMALFMALHLGGAVLGDRLPDHHLFIAVLVFFLSLVVLAWPVFRGAAWATVREDVGLTFGRRPLLEGVIGPGGYAMALPMFAVGVLVLFILMSIHMALRQAGGEAETLSPDVVPGHPALQALERPGAWIRVQLFLLAVVAAPIVEEIMFRGVLYRHLRDCFRSPAIGAALPILGSAAVTGFIFAVIHPVPWFAWPALMALAIAFALAREWRGTVFPSILMHAIHNAILTVTIVLILQA